MVKAQERCAIRAFASLGLFLLGLLADAGLPRPLQIPALATGVLLLALAVLRVSFVGTLTLVPIAALILWVAHHPTMGM